MLEEFYNNPLVRPAIKLAGIAVFALIIYLVWKYGPTIWYDERWE